MTMRGVLLVVGFGMAGGLGRAATPVDPAALAGAWSGTWENRSFNPHPTGTVNATVSIPDATTVVVTYVASGGVFGGCTVPETTLTLVKDVDFTDTSLAFTRQDATFGTVTVASKRKGKRLVGEGTGTCGGSGPPWNARGKYRNGIFAVKMRIRLPGKIAKTKIQLTKQPAA